MNYLFRFDELCMSRAAVRTCLIYQPKTDRRQQLNYPVAFGEMKWLGGNKSTAGPAG
jgi:hypothetical protein